MSEKRTLATERIGLRVSPETKLAWEKSAARAGLTLSAWLKQAAAAFDKTN